MYIEQQVIDDSLKNAGEVTFFVITLARNTIFWFRKQHYMVDLSFLYPIQLKT